MTAMLTIGNFNVRIVEIGSKFGHIAINNYAEPLVEFYDNRYIRPEAGWVFGQPVSHYLISTMLERNANYGLDLDSGIPEWCVSVAEMKQVDVWLFEYLLQSVEF